MSKIPFGYDTVYEEKWDIQNPGLKWEKLFNTLYPGEIMCVTDNSAPDNENALRVGNFVSNDSSCIVSRNSIKLEKDKLYKIRVSYKVLRGEGKVKIGIVCRNNSDTEYIDSTGGTNVLNSFFVINDMWDDEWEVYEFYFRLPDADNGVLELTGSFTNYNDPFVLKNGTGYIRIVLMSNLPNKTGITLYGSIYVDSIKLVDAYVNPNLKMLSEVKRTIDNESFLFLFEGNKNYAYSKNFIYKKYNINETYSKSFFSEHILKRMTNEFCYGIYYKNSKGKWVNYRKILEIYPLQNPLMVAEDLYYSSIQNIRINPNTLPPVEFTDENGFVYNIDAADGEEIYTRRLPLCLSEMETDIVKITQCSIEDPNLSFSLRHMMDDIKVELPNNYDSSDYLVWLNGVFVPILKDSTKKNIFYIPDGLLLVPHVVKDCRPDAPLVYRKKNGSIVNATIEESDEYAIHRYDFKIRLFSWENTKVKTWEKPRNVSTYTIFGNHNGNGYVVESVKVINELYFEVPVNLDAHFIICNGIALTPDEYYVDPKDNRHVYLTKVVRQADMLYREAIEYGTPNPIELIRPLLTDRTYYLVNFESKDPNNPVLMKRSKSNIASFPYQMEVTFSDVEINDLVLCDGLYIPYEFVHRKTIRFPKTKYTTESLIQTMTREKFERIYFVDKE